MSVLSLPREVRDMVYCLCLEVEHVIVPYPTKNETKFQGSSPCVALLEVNKTIRAETRPILYRHNKWQVDFAPSDSNLFEIVEPSFFEHVVLKLSGDADLKTDRMSTFAQMHDDLEKKVFRFARGLTEFGRTQARAKEIHSKLFLDLQVCWSHKMRFVWGLQHLRSIIIDVSRLFCPSGCCRFEMIRNDPFRRVLDWLMYNKDVHVYGPKVFFVGLRNKKESRYMYKTYGFKKWALDTYEMDGQDVKIDVTRKHPIEEEYSDASESETSIEDL